MSITGEDDTENDDGVEGYGATVAVGSIEVVGGGDCGF